MNARTLPRIAVDRSLRIARLPVDASISLLPGDETGPRPAAKLAVDRVDATIRSIAGTILSDPILRDDARARDAASNERERAMKLRVEAERQTEQADARLGDRHDQAERQRERADQRATDKIKQAEAARKDKTEHAQQREEKRLSSSRDAEARAKDAVEHRANEQRVVALDAKSESLSDREDALTAADEASRLASAAARAKEQRKNGQS